MTTIYTKNYNINHVYRDLNLSLEVHPLTGNYKTTDGIEAVKKSVKHLIQSNKWDFPFQPDIYGGTEHLLFETATPVYITHVQNTIRDLLEKYEPRVSVIMVDVHVRDNALFITIEYEIIAVEMKVETKLTIKRER